MPRYPLDQASRPNRLQAAPLTPSESPQLSKNSTVKDETPMPDNANKRHIEAWLEASLLEEVPFSRPLEKLSTCKRDGLAKLCCR